MPIITAGSDSPLDMYETSIASALTPQYRLINSGQLALSYNNGLENLLSGTGFRMDDGEITGGTIVGISEYRDGQLSFTARDLLIPAQMLARWFDESDYGAFFPFALSGEDLIVGSNLSDRMLSAGGNDYLAGLDGDDELDGGEANDTLDGGTGDDYIDGGAGYDTALFASTVRQVHVTRGSDGLIVDGPEGIDTLENVEVLQFADGRIVFDPDSNGAKLQRLYSAVFDRIPDQVGFESWLDLLHDHGWTMNQVAHDFLHSAEFQSSGADINSNVAFVDFLYKQVLHRTADAGGRAYWINALEGGYTRPDVLLQFSESAEHRTLTAGLIAGGYVETDDDFQNVALLYDGFADRHPDADGLIAWAGALKSGAMTLKQVAAGIAASDEFRIRTAGFDNGQLVDTMYRTALDREADASGRAYWVDALDHGLEVGDLLLGFSLSAEHQALMSAYIYGGIEVL